MGVREFIERASLLTGADDRALDRIAAAVSVRTLRRGEWLWRAGDPAHSLSIIKSGLVKIVRPTARGGASICGIFGSPSSVGELAVMRGIPYPADAVVATATATVINIPGNLLLDASQTSPRIAVSVACSMHEKVTQLHDKVAVLSAGAVEARLATLLIKLYDRFGDDFDDGTHVVPVALSRRELAELIATSFETAIRVMTRWERNGVVTTTAQGFVIRDLPALRATARAEAPAAAAE